MGPALAAKIVEVARDMGVSPYDLANLIRAESGFDPTAQNMRVAPAHRPVGLIQFIPSTAARLGYTPAQILAMAPVQQMNVVRRYLLQFGPFPTKQALFLAVFYPAARYWPPTKLFPEKVWRANPIYHGKELTGYIKTPADYVAFVERAAKIRSTGIFV